MSDIRHEKESGVSKQNDNRGQLSNFVLDKGIFSNIFEKDIRRVYIYKKAERLAKAIHLVGPAFRNSVALRNRLDQVAVGLIDSAILPPASARDSLSRELLALSSVLAIARTGGLLSSMNADLIAHEAHLLLQEIATYEEPRLFLDEAPTLAGLSKELGRENSTQTKSERIFEGKESKKADRKVSGGVGVKIAKRERSQADESIGHSQGHISDKKDDRREAIKSVLRSKGSSYIKDISTVIRDVSEKTIQRELQALVDEGIVSRSGERRWTTYTLV